MIIERTYENEVVFKEVFHVLGDYGRMATEVDSYEKALDKGAEYLAVGCTEFRVEKRYVKLTQEELAAMAATPTTEPTTHLNVEPTTQLHLNVGDTWA